MRRMTFLWTTLILALVGAACTPTATATQIPTIAVPVTGSTVRPPSIVITATSRSSAATPTTAATAEAPTGEATTDTAATTGPKIDTSIRIGATTSTSVREPYLVDQTGRSLYIYTQDTQNDVTSACTDECATIWLPVIVTGTPTAGSGANTAMLGTITRADGKLQATYNGWPLYYYSGDRTVGARNGQGLENSWFLVSATGNAIQQ